MKLKIGSLKSSIYYIILTLYTFYTLVFGVTDLNTYFGWTYADFVDIISVIIFVLVIVCLSLQSYTINELGIIAVVSVVLLISTIITKDTSLLFALSFVVTAKNINYRRALICIFTTMLIFTALSVSLSIAGEWQSGNQSSLAIWGFGQKNRLGSVILNLTLLWFIIRRDKIKKLEKFIVFFVALGFVFVISSRTPMILLVLWLILDFAFCRKSNNNVYNYHLELLPFAFTIILLVLIVGYKYEIGIVESINQLMTGRIALVADFVDDYGVSLIGQKVLFEKPFDNTYFRLLCVNGILSFLIFSFGYYFLIKKLVQKKEGFLLAIVVVFVVQGCIESFSMQLIYNFSLIFISFALFNKNTMDSIGVLENEEQLESVEEHYKTSQFNINQ